MELTEKIKWSLMAYAHLDELTPDEEDDFEDCFQGAVSYMEDAGVVCPEEGTKRWHKYMRCLKAIFLDDWDNRGAQTAGHVLTENPAFRRRLNQLKLTEPVVSDSDTTGIGT